MKRKASSKPRKTSRRAERDLDMVFYGEKNDFLFRRFSSRMTDAELHELHQNLLRMPGVHWPLTELTKAGCPVLPLILRVAVVALVWTGLLSIGRDLTSGFAIIAFGTRDPHRLKAPPRFGGLTKKYVKTIAKDASSLAANLEDLSNQLFASSAALYSNDRERRKRLCAMAELLRTCATDVLAEVSTRQRVPRLGWEPPLRSLYLSGLCDFVREKTDKNLYGAIGRLVASVASLTGSEDLKKRDEFSNAAVRMAVTRFRDRIAKAKTPTSAA